MESRPEDATENLSFPLAIFSILLPSDQSYFRRKLGDLIFAALQRRAFPPQSLQNWGGISKFSFRPLSGNDSDERLFCAIFFSGVIWFCLGNMLLPKMSQPESGVAFCCLKMTAGAGKIHDPPRKMESGFKRHAGKEVQMK